MADAPVLISNEGAVASPNTYTLPPGLDFEPSVITALFNGASSTDPYLAALSFYAQSGELLGRTFPEGPVPAGGSTRVTFAPTLSSEGATTQGDATPYKLISGGSTNSTLVRAGSGKIVDYFLSNQNAAVRYVKLYDKATAPTVGTDVPKWTLAIPPGASAHLGMAAPLVFNLGIGLGITTGVTDADTGAVAANEIVVNLAYI